MSSSIFFVYRPGMPYRGLQMVECSGSGTLKPAVLRFGVHDPTTFLTWRLYETDIVEEEKKFVRNLNYFRSGVGNDWYCGISKYFLRCNEAPNLRFRILHINSSRFQSMGLLLKTPVRKDSIVIPLTDYPYEHTISAEDRTRILPIVTRSQNVQWFCEGQHLFFPPGHPAQQAPIQMQATVAATIALSTFIANTLVQHALAQPDAHCPISYDPLQECNRFCVGNCGHVYSDVVATMQTCPMCTRAVTWTAVEIPA